MINLKDYAGVILYEGPSMIDGAPIVVIANRIDTDSNNAKTGAMVQTFIMRQDIAPHEATKTGDDASICGDCTHRPAMADHVTSRYFKRRCLLGKPINVGAILRLTLNNRQSYSPVGFSGLALMAIRLLHRFRYGGRLRLKLKDITAIRINGSASKRSRRYAWQALTM